MRYMLRAILTGTSTLGLAMVVGCGAASNQPGTCDAPGEFHVARSITSSEPRRLAHEDSQGHDITFARDCSRWSNTEMMVTPVAARDALPRSVFVVQPAAPLASGSVAAVPESSPKLILPPADRGLDLSLPHTAPAPPPRDVVGEWTPPAVEVTAQSSSRMLRTAAPEDWQLAQRLTGASDWVAPPLDPPLAESTPVETAPVVSNDEHDAPCESFQPAPPTPLAAVEEALPTEEFRGEPTPANAEPLSPILLTPEAAGPDSHWPSTVVPLPPVDGFQPLAPNAPLPDEADTSPVPVPEVQPPSAPSAPPARELESAPLARPIPGNAPQRSAEMEAVSRLANTRVQEGFALAQHGAIFAARSEFIQALRILAQAKDTEQQTNRHSQALADGFRAIDEADELLPSGSRLEANLDLTNAIVGHRTPVLQGVDTSNMTVTAALQHYYTYAQEQLALSGDGEPVASMALYGLGKLHATLARQPSTNVKSAEPKSMIYHQAAMLVDGRNYLAANDLGVLLVRMGRLTDARDAFLHSLSQQPQEQTWKNLSAVHRHLGEPELAAQAHHRAEDLARAAQAQLAASGPTTSPNAVTWVEPSEFASGVPKTAARPTPATPDQPLKPIAEEETPTGIKRFLPSWGTDKNQTKR